MFAGGRRRSSNIRVMQLFHELKQQFPTVPDHVVSACIANYAQRNSSNDQDQHKSIQQVLEATIALENQESMGRQAVDPADPAVPRSSNPLTEDTIEVRYLCDEKNNAKEQNNNSKIYPTLEVSNDTKTRNSHHTGRENHEKNSHKGHKKTHPRSSRHGSKNKGSYRRSIDSETDNQEQRSCSAEQNKINETLSEKSSRNVKDNSLSAGKNQNLSDRQRPEMNEGESDPSRNSVVKPSVFYSKDSESVSVSGTDDPKTQHKVGNSSFFIKRPTHLDIKSDQDVPGDGTLSSACRIRPSERCFDIQKLLHSEHSDSKPPRSPLSAKRFAKNSPVKTDNFKSPLASPETCKKSPSSSKTSRDTASKNLPSPVAHVNTNPFCSGAGSSNSFSQINPPPPLDPSPKGVLKKDCDRRPETVETPTQTTNSLLEGVNLSLKVDCSMGLVQSPTRSRRSSVLNVTPELPWCPSDSPTSQRSYTSVNLTLRPPSSEPQAPIDITSQNSSLTYSTSSFDSQKGLQSRLQITVGPGGGTVSSVRTRPKSSYIPQDSPQETVPVRAGSLPDLAAKDTSSVISKQQVRIDRLRIELITEKGRLVAMQREVAALENHNNTLTSKVDIEIEKQLLKEIKHLRGQCEQLVFEVERQSECRVPLGETNEEFYRNIYTGQRGPLTIERPLNNPRPTYQQSLPPPSATTEVEGPKWNCPVCTFQNHPLLNKCEQCEMPRILHGSMKQEASNPRLAFGMVRHFSENGPASASNPYFNHPYPRSSSLPGNTVTVITGPYASNNYHAAINPNVNYCHNQRL